MAPFYNLWTIVMLPRCIENKNEQNGQEYLKTDSLKDLGYHDRGFALLPTRRNYVNFWNLGSTLMTFTKSFSFGTIRINRKDKMHKIYFSTD